jgi:hypothetical protein
METSWSENSELVEVEKNNQEGRNDEIVLETVVFFLDKYRTGELLLDNHS